MKVCKTFRTVISFLLPHLPLSLSRDPHTQKAKYQITKTQKQKTKLCVVWCVVSCPLVFQSPGLKLHTERFVFTEEKPTKREEKRRGEKREDNERTKTVKRQDTTCVLEDVSFRCVDFCFLL